MKPVNLFCKQTVFLAKFMSYGSFLLHKPDFHVASANQFMLLAFAGAVPAEADRAFVNTLAELVGYSLGLPPGVKAELLAAHLCFTHVFGL